jgi:hypothetical protein
MTVELASEIEHNNKIVARKYVTGVTEQLGVSRDLKWAGTDRHGKLLKQLHGTGISLYGAGCSPKGSDSQIRIGDAPYRVEACDGSSAGAKWL